MRIKPEDKEAMLELVREEIEQHRLDPDYKLSTRAKLADLLECSERSVCNYLKELGDDLRDEHTRVIFIQTGKEAARMGVGAHGNDTVTEKSYSSIGGKTIGKKVMEQNHARTERNQ